MRAAGLSGFTSGTYRVVLVWVWQMKALLCTLVIMYNLNRSVLIGAPYGEVVGDFFNATPIWLSTDEVLSEFKSFV